MKISHSCFAFAILAMAQNSHAQSVTAVPVGAMTLSIPGGSAAMPSVTTFSIPLRKSTPENFTGQNAGRITGITATTISNTSAGWAPGALSQAPTPHFLRITSGSAAGRTLQVSSSVANTADTLSVLNQDTDLSTLGIATGASGDTYEIFPGETLAGFFGNSTLAGATAASADVVRLLNGSTWSEYYYHSTANQWRLGSVPANQNNVVLRPDTGVMFYRRGSNPLTYTIQGIVPSTPIRTIVNNSGITYLGNVFPVDRTLSASGFNAIPGWVNHSGSITAADKVVIWGGSSFNYYNYHQTASQWRIGSVPVNQNNVIIAAGVPALIERPGSASGVSTLVRNLPYNLNP